MINRFLLRKPHPLEYNVIGLWKLCNFHPFWIIELNIRSSNKRKNGFTYFFVCCVLIQVKYLVFKFPSSCNKHELLCNSDENNSIAIFWLINNSTFSQNLEEKVSVSIVVWKGKKGANVFYGVFCSLYVFWIVLWYRLDQFCMRSGFLF